ncbi:MAG TPA: DsbA family protein [Armatimonadaceae bacterium]|nr:DsbA family protein [Armatimonadaceae bacterium]
MSGDSVRLEVFSDYVCPFCWLAEPAVRALAQADPGVEITWRAFELRPEPVPTLDPAGGYLERVWQHSVYPMAAQMGIPIQLPPVQPRSRRAHEAAHWARAHGAFDAYSAALFRAFFERGEDIGQVDVLAALAAGLGLDAASLRETLEAGTFEEAVLDDQRAATTMGVMGVPAFVADGRFALSGVQPLGELQALVARARASNRERYQALAG